jgi:hypothetical protein
VTTHETGEHYAGPAEILDGKESVRVGVDLRGGFQPIDGRFHWYGRVGGDARLASGDRVTIRTDHGTAKGRLSDVDPWGRLRIAGIGQPPF